MSSLTAHPDRLNAMFLSTDGITLTDLQIDRAIELSQRIATEAQQWQLYLTILARLGVYQWLQKRAPELQISGDRLSASTALAGDSQLQIGAFRLYLIATDDVAALEISLPQAAIESAFTPHLYILVEVLEEIGQVQIRSAIQQARLVEQLQSATPEAGHYWLDMNWFDATPDRLLLWLRCLDASAMPTVAPIASVTSSSTAAMTTTASPNAIPNTIPNTIPSATPNAIPRAINLATWLNDRLDQVAQEFSWILMPAPAPNLAFSGLRSPMEEFSQVLTQLTQQGRIHPLPQARSGYCDVQWGGAMLRLYTATWQSGTEADYWTLLLILGPQPGATIPIGTRLQIRDATQILTEPALIDRTQDYLFAQVIGTEAECFWVSIGAQDGTTLTLPPFTFIKDDLS